jgi:hypothetical protein
MTTIHIRYSHAQDFYYHEHDFYYHEHNPSYNSTYRALKINIKIHKKTDHTP